MLLTKELVFVLLLSVSAVTLGRIHGGKPRVAGIKIPKSRASAIPVPVRVPLVVNSRFKTQPIPEVIPEQLVPDVSPNSQPNPEPNPNIISAPIPNHSIPRAVGATPCQTASQWEGSASEWDHILGINNRYNITFDGVNRRKRIMEDKHAQLPGKRIYEYIMLYDRGIQYVINHNYNTCTVQKLGTWRNHTIPPNATLEDMQEIGPPGSGFLVQEWSDRIPGRQKESWIGTFSNDGCWPLTETFMEKDEHSEMIQSVSTRFFNLSEGIRNMSVFTPPAICNQTHHPINPNKPTLVPPQVPARSIPSGSRPRPKKTQRLLSLSEIPRLPADLNRMLDQLPSEQGRAILDAILSGDPPQNLEGLDRFTYQTISKLYRVAGRRGG